MKTFKEWFSEIVNNVNYLGTDLSRAAWDHQQIVIDKLTKALEFYGDKENYSEWGFLLVNKDSYSDCDKEYLGNDGKKDRFNIIGGKLARQILEETK